MSSPLSKYFFLCVLLAVVFCNAASAWSITDYQIDDKKPKLYVYGVAGTKEPFTVTITSPDRASSAVEVKAGTDGAYIAVLPLTTSHGGIFTIDVYYKRQIVSSMGIKIRSDEIPYEYVSYTPTPTPTPTPTNTPTPTTTPTPVPAVTPTPDPGVTVVQTSSPVHHGSSYTIVDGKVVPVGQQAASDGTPIWVWAICGIAVVGGIVFYLFKE